MSEGIVVGTVRKPDKTKSRDAMLRDVVAKVVNTDEEEALVVKLTDSQRSRLYHVAKQEGVDISTTAHETQPGTWLVYKKD